MSSVPKKLTQRRLALLAKTQVQREMLIAESCQFKQSLQFLELGFQAGQTIKRHPLISAGVAAATLLIKPKRIWSLLKTGLMAWEIWQNIAPSIMPKLKQKLGSKTVSKTGSNTTDER